MIKNLLNAADSYLFDSMAVRKTMLGMAKKDAAQKAVKSNKEVTKQPGFIAAMLKDSKFGKLVSDLTPDGMPKIDYTLSEQAQDKINFIRNTASEVYERGGDAHLKKVVDAAASRSGAGATYERKALLGDRLANYYTNAEKGKTRRIATGIGIGAGMVGARVATGGSLLYNGNGKKDIVGIPFV